MVDSSDCGACQWLTAQYNILRPLDPRKSLYHSVWAFTGVLPSVGLLAHSSPKSDSRSEAARSGSNYTSSHVSRKTRSLMSWTSSC